MSIFPQQNRGQSIQVQSQQIYPFGCCFTSFRFANNRTTNPPPQGCRFYSEPKQSKAHKIDLTIGKRRLSQTKSEKDRQHTLSKERIQTISSKSRKEAVNQHSKAILTINSKITAQRSSFKAPKVSFNKGIKLDYPIRQQKVSWITTSHTNINKLEQQDSSKQDFTSLPFISQISIVQEEFVSQGSESLQALNFVTQMQISEKKNLPSTVLQLQLSRITQEKESRGSVSRLGQFKKEVTGSGRKCLIL